MPRPAERRSYKILAVTHSEDDFYFRVEQVKCVDEIDIQILRIDKGRAFNPLMEVQHGRHPLSYRIEGVRMRVCAEKIPLQDIVHPEFMMATHQLGHGTGP